MIWTPSGKQCATVGREAVRGQRGQRSWAGYCEECVSDSWGRPAGRAVLRKGAHYWARVLTARGHGVRLISPLFVKPFLKSQKNDANTTKNTYAGFKEFRQESRDFRSHIDESRTAVVRSSTKTVDC
jgi:transposase